MLGIVTFAVWFWRSPQRRRSQWVEASPRPRRSASTSSPIRRRWIRSPYSEIVAGRILATCTRASPTSPTTARTSRRSPSAGSRLNGQRASASTCARASCSTAAGPFTAKDVKYTFEELLRPGDKGGLSATYLNDIVGAEEMKDGTAKELPASRSSTTHRRHRASPSRTCCSRSIRSTSWTAASLPSTAPDWMTKVSAGTGPYKFRAVDGAASRSSSRRNKEYWGGAPKIDGVSFVIVPNADTALSQYDAGELDFVDVYDDGVPPRAARRALRQGR